MTPQLEEARRLLRLARRDSDTFDLLRPLPTATLYALGFHAQQGVEKALKAVSVVLGIEFQRTHDLASLGQAILDRGQTLPVMVDQLRKLNPFAVEFRYDDEMLPLTTRDELSAMLSAILRWSAQLVEA